MHSCRQSPGCGSAMWRTCNSTSKAESSTHYGRWSATGTLTSISAATGNIIVSGITIGTYTNSAGTLVFTFNVNATNARVNSAMQQIAYANSSEAPPASVQIDWTFKRTRSLRFG